MAEKTKRQDLTEELAFRTLSRHQYGSLKFIANNHVTLEYLRIAHATTLASLAYRQLIAARGPGESAEVVLTKLGEEALRIYNDASLNQRGKEGDLTGRCMRLLRHARRVSAA